MLCLSYKIHLQILVSYIHVCRYVHWIADWDFRVPRPTVCGCLYFFDFTMFMNSLPRPFLPGRAFIAVYNVPFLPSPAPHISSYTALYQCYCFCVNTQKFVLEFLHLFELRFYHFSHNFFLCVKPLVRDHDLPANTLGVKGGRSIS